MGLLGVSGLPWFRMYAEFATDPDVQTLAFEDQRHYLVVLCLKCNGIIDNDYPTTDRRHHVIRRTLGLDTGAAEECKRRLMQAGFIDDGWQPLGCENRQYASDSSADRTREWRERKERLGDVTVTDKSQIQRQISTNTKRASKRCPEDFAITDDLRIWAEQKTPGVNIDAETEAFKDYEFKNAHSDWKATWRQWMRTAATRVSHGTRKSVSQPRISALERQRRATEAWLAEGEASGGGGVVIDG
jgi:hypothetical protein